MKTGILALDPDTVIAMIGCSVAVIDYFGVLDDGKIKCYFELDCEVKRLGRGISNTLKTK
ncbi:MAG: hypothetical protein ABR911_02755 [Syntrophales bacterium]